MAYPSLISAVSLCALLGASTVAHAQFADKRAAPTLYMQTGAAEHKAGSVTIGSTMPLGYTTYWWGNAVTTHWDLSLGTWNAENSSGSRQGVAVIGMKPVLRFHSKSRYPWFVEAGVGGYLSSKLYDNRGERSSTAFNFGTHLGLGYYTGMRREHEWMLRVEHVSNAGIKQPNPGENFVQLRYARHF